MDHLLDHNTKESEWITYEKKSVSDPTNEFYKRTSRRVFWGLSRLELATLVDESSPMTARTQVKDIDHIIG